MTETPAFLAERLRVEGEKTSAFFEALPPNQWETMVYTEDAHWSVRSILIHFVYAEKSFLKLLPYVQAGGPGVSEDFDIDSHNALQQTKAEKLTNEELQNEFKQGRAEMVRWVSGLAQDDLQKTGRHPFLGITTLGEMIKLVYRHHQIHFRDVRQHLHD